MKKGKANGEDGAKLSRYDIRAEYALMEAERKAAQPPMNPEYAGGFYVVAVGETRPPESLKVFMGKYGREVYDAQQAMAFDTYGDALKWAVANCDYSQMDFVYRGFEKPRYPRVCYVRIYTELTEL